jgi:heme-degrading monooxygenase HmoA
VSRNLCVRRDGDGRQRELLQGPPRARWLALISLVFLYETRDTEEFENAYGPGGDWAQFFAGATGYLGSDLLRDLDQPGRYLVVDRWETVEAYNAFIATNGEEYMRRSDEMTGHYVQELRLGTFETA